MNNTVTIELKEWVYDEFVELLKTVCHELDSASPYHISGEASCLLSFLDIIDSSRR